MEKGSSLVSGLTQLRGVVAILQWWGFNVLVIIMNKWIFQVGDCVIGFVQMLGTIFHLLAVQKILRTFFAFSYLDES
jgi:hypothetical protein